MSGKNRWGTRNEGVKGKKTVGQAVTEARKETNKKGALTNDEKLKILDLYRENDDTNLIAQAVNRPVDTIRKFMWKYRSTLQSARMRLEAGAETLAGRVVEQANVTESLEVLDRLDVLSKKRDKAAPVSSFSLIIGNPVIGTPLPSARKDAIDVVPVPTQKQIDDAIEAEVVSGKG